MKLNEISDEFDDLVSDEPVQNINDKFGVTCAKCGQNQNNTYECTNPKCNKDVCEYCVGYRENQWNYNEVIVSCPFCHIDINESQIQKNQPINEDEFDDLLGDEPVQDIDDKFSNHENLWPDAVSCANLLNHYEPAVITTEVVSILDAYHNNHIKSYLIRGSDMSDEDCIRLTRQVATHSEFFITRPDSFLPFDPKTQRIAIDGNIFVIKQGRYWVPVMGYELAESEEFDDLLGDEPLHDIEDQWSMIDIINNLTSRDHQIEQQILRYKYPEFAYYYADDIIKGRWPEAEPFIMKDPKWAYYYACNIINGKWPEAEPFIMKDPKWSSFYAQYCGITESEEFDYILGDEPVGDIDDQWDMMDIIGRIAGRDPQIEQAILNSENPKWAYFYAYFIMKGRWPEAEPFIMKNSEWAFWYAIRVIGGRWPEAERVIMKDPEWARFYQSAMPNITESEEFDDLLGDEPINDIEDQWSNYQRCDFCDTEIATYGQCNECGMISCDRCCKDFTIDSEHGPLVAYKCASCDGRLNILFAESEEFDDLLGDGPVQQGDDRFADDFEFSVVIYNIKQKTNYGETPEQAYERAGKDITQWLENQFPSARFTYRYSKYHSNIHNNYPYINVTHHGEPSRSLVQLIMYTEEMRVKGWEFYIDEDHYIIESAEFDDLLGDEPVQPGEDKFADGFEFCIWVNLLSKLNRKSIAPKVVQDTNNFLTKLNNNRVHSVTSGIYDGYLYINYNIYEPSEELIRWVDYYTSSTSYRQTFIGDLELTVRPVNFTINESEEFDDLIGDEPVDNIEDKFQNPPPEIRTANRLTELLNIVSATISDELVKYERGPIPYKIHLICGEGYGREDRKHCLKFTFDGVRWFIDDDIIRHNIPTDPKTQTILVSQYNNAPVKVVKSNGRWSTVWNIQESAEFDDLLGDEPVQQGDDKFQNETTFRLLIDLNKDRYEYETIEQTFERALSDIKDDLQDKFLTIFRHNNIGMGAVNFMADGLPDSFFNWIRHRNGKDFTLGWSPVKPDSTGWSVTLMADAVNESAEFDDLLGDEPVGDIDDQWDMMDIIGRIAGRDPQVEQQILRSENPKWAYWYAHDVIKGRWPEAEYFIMKYPEWIYWYASRAIHGRWPEAEPLIMKDPEWAKTYKKNFNITESAEFDDLAGDDPLPQGDDKFSDLFQCPICHMERRHDPPYTESRICKKCKTEVCYWCCRESPKTNNSYCDNCWDGLSVKTRHPTLA